MSKVTVPVISKLGVKLDQRSSRFINFGAGRRVRPNAKAASDQNCVIGEQSGCVRMAACVHPTHMLEPAASRYIKFRFGAPIPTGHLATGNQDRSIGKAGSRGEFLTDRALPMEANVPAAGSYTSTSAGSGKSLLPRNGKTLPSVSNVAVYP